MQRIVIILILLGVLLLGGLYLALPAGMVPSVIDDMPGLMSTSTDAAVPNNTMATSSAEIRIDETLQDVTFCGKTYQSKQVFVDDIEIIGRIAEIASTERIPIICNDLDRHQREGYFDKVLNISLEHIDVPIERLPAVDRYLLEINRDDLVFVIDMDHMVLRYGQSPAGNIMIHDLRKNETRGG